MNLSEASGTLEKVWESTRPGRGGFTLIELFVALLLTGFCLSATWTVFSQHHRAALVAAGTAEGLEVVRTTGWLLAEELYGARRGQDFRPVQGDSLALRAFRGLGIPEGLDPRTGSLVVCFRGLRQVDTSKDSVLLLGNGGGWRAHAVESRRGGDSACSSDAVGRIEVWELDPVPRAVPVLARVFESGVYFLRDGAFRYRRGLGGRQPLTPERVNEGFFLPGTTRGQRLRWALRLEGPDGMPNTVTWEGALW